MEKLSLGVLTDTTAGTGMKTVKTSFTQNRRCIAHVNVNPTGIVTVDVEVSPDDVTYTSVATANITVAGMSTIIDVPRLARYVRAKCSYVAAGQVEVVLLGDHG